METPTEVIITRTGQRSWRFTDNINPNTQSKSLYSGDQDGDLITITSYRGSTLYNRVPWQAFEYVDATDPGSDFSFSSADELFDFLNNLEGFFYKGNTGGGGSITDFNVIDANDVNIPTLLGQGGKLFAVNAAGTDFILIPNSGTQFRIANALDYTGGTFQPNKYLATNATGTSIVQADINQIINTPIAVDEFRVIAKGSQGGVPNSEPFVKEIGDRCAGVSSLDGRFYTNLEYNGGTESDIANYTIKSYDEPVN